MRLPWKFHMSEYRSARLARKSLERLDLLLLTIESLDLNGSESILWTSKKLGLDTQIPNRVELWKRRCLNPLRKTSRRGILSQLDFEALITLITAMSDRLYPLIRQLLSSREPSQVTTERWDLLNKRFQDLIKERMNIRRGAVSKLLNIDTLCSKNRELILTLALCSGPGGQDRLRAALLD